MPNNVQLDLGGHWRVVAYKVQSCTGTCDWYSCRAQGLPCTHCSIMCMQLVCNALPSLVARYLAYHLYKPSLNISSGISHTTASSMLDAALIKPEQLMLTRRHTVQFVTDSCCSRLSVSKQEKNFWSHVTFSYERQLHYELETARIGAALEHENQGSDFSCHHYTVNLSKTTTAQGTFKMWSLLPGGLLIQGHLTGNSIPWSWFQWSSRTDGRLIRVVALTGFTVLRRTRLSVVRTMTVSNKTKQLVLPC